jgi:iron complex outermembrane receptor protein
MTRRFGSTSPLRASVSSAALAAAWLLAAHPAAAQASAQAPAAAAKPTDDGDQPVVTVTAERRKINLQTAPLAATVVAGAQLQQRGIETVDDLQFHAPSLTVVDAGGSVLLNIRGLGKDLNNVQTPSGVVTYWDGVATFPGFFQNSPYYDISNIEVLRGPQGTFAGQNADAGALFITTNDPHLHTYSADVEAQYGNYSDYLVRGAVNIPISDTLALRIAANGENRDSFYQVSGPWTTSGGHTPGSLSEGSFRLGLLWQPTDALRVVLKTSADYVDTYGAPADPVLDPADPARLNPEDIFHVSSFINDYAVTKDSRSSLNISYTFNDGIVLKSISAYQAANGYTNIDLTEVFPGASFADNANEQIYSQELNLISPDKGPFRWVGGLYYQHDYVELVPGNGNTGFDIGVPHGTFDEDLHYKTPKQTAAVFGQASYDITPALQLQAGARYTYETFGLSDSMFDQSGGVTIPGTTFSYNAHTSDSGVTGKLALNWTLNPDNFLYAFVATGRKAGGLNTEPYNGNPSSAPAPFAPETVTDYEIGWKPTFADGHVRAQLDGYFSQYQNFQLQFASPGEPGANAPVRNAGGTTNLYGVEAELQAVFGPFSLDAGGSYEHSELGAFVVQDPVSGATLHLAGRPVPLAPEWTANIGGQYVYPLANGATLTPRIEYSYASSQWATPYEDFGDLLASRNLVNVSLAYDQGPYRVTFYADNATNLHYLIGTNIGLRYAGAPAQYGIRLEGKF